MTGTERRDGADIAAEWWRDLVSEEPGLRATRGARRAALARLRRADTPIEVMQEPEALRLIRRLPRNPDRVAILAGVLAFVREPDDQRIARAIGRESFDEEDKALMSEARFRRLLQTPGNDLMDPLRRLIRLTKGKANVRDLSSSVLYWGDRVRKRWIFDYYGVSDSLRSPGNVSNATSGSSET